VTEGFEGRWLNSRKELAPLRASPQSSGMPLRAISREKGIGRSAIVGARGDLEAASPVRNTLNLSGGRLFRAIPPPRLILRFVSES